MATDVNPMHLHNLPTVTSGDNNILAMQKLLDETENNSESAR